tara:strand:- start:460 stop:588 length:129 start_codon:yes stop_codon:yes gene_type:complete
MAEVIVVMQSWLTDLLRALTGSVAFGVFSLMPDRAALAPAYP